MSWFHLVTTVMAVITLGVGVYFNKVGTKSLRTTEVQAPEVLSEETQATTAPGLSPSPSASIKPTATPTSNPTSIPTPGPNAQNSLDSFIYPGSSVTTKTSNTLTLSSSSEPKTIISWYQDKLKQINMKATGISSTNTNGNYVAKMAASTNNSKVNIEITKSADQSVTKIIVTLSY